MSRADQSSSISLDEHRVRLLAEVPVTERRVEAAGIPTAVLVGGDGPSVVLLHGPGESAVNWRWTIPDLVRTHRVVAPDLPAHGSSGSGDAPLDAARAVAWLGEVLRTVRLAAPRHRRRSGRPGPRPTRGLPTEPSRCAQR